MKAHDVVLVTEKDEAVGTMEKLKAHQEGLLHRAFSVFIFDREGRMLLQQRALNKYHGGGLWTNTCCSHPYPGENVEDAAVRRLSEEMGFTTRLKKIFAFTYHAHVENGLIEHEYDHVFTGEYNGAMNINSSEVADYCYKEMHEIKKHLAEHPGKFTAWFQIAFPSIEQWWQQAYGAAEDAVVKERSEENISLKP